jgi:hypothetical protein
MLESGLLASLWVLLSLVRVEGDLRRILVAATLYIASILLLEPGSPLPIFPFYFVLTPQSLLPELHVLCNHSFSLLGVLLELIQQHGLFHFQPIGFGQENLVIFFRIISKREALHIHTHSNRHEVESRS